MSETSGDNEQFPIEPQQAEVLPPDSQAIPKPRKLSRLFANKKLLALSIVIILVIVGSSLAFLRLHKTKDSSLSSPSVGNKSTASANLPKASPIVGNTYLDSPKQLPDLHFFKNADVFGNVCTGYDQATQTSTDCSPAVKLSDISYYQIGTAKDGSRIIVFEVPNGIDSMDIFALGKTDGTYSVLGQMDKALVDSQSDYLKSFASNVTIDSTTKLNDITFPATVTVNGQNLKTDYPTLDMAMFMKNGLVSIRGGFFGDLKDSSQIHKILDKDGLRYYEVTASDQPTFDVMEIYATYNNLFSIDYQPAGEIASAAGNLSASWTSGESNSSTYFSGGQGCGSRGYVVAKDLDKTQLITVGTTKKGQKLYQLPTGNPLVQEIYTKDYGNGEGLNDNSLKDLTVQQITDKHAYFLAQNGLGEYVLFQRDDMFIRGGCAKPVIYLYPQQTMAVSLSIGAKITKSEPNYGSGGWSNVIAKPNGDLSFNSKHYSSLFWEGYGDGAYPSITSGTIVRSKDAGKTIRQQLAQQGLNNTEIADFMAFWGPKLPTDKPYTRVSWLNTGQMNQLAPLKISPAPRTLIRVFLDYQALDKPYELAPQKLVAPQRLGFTVVEWGGLLNAPLDD